jgi:uncharacterized protein (TIGR00725 family)
MVSVFGTGSPSDEQRQLARATGFFLAKRGFIVLNGGQGGVMEEVSKGAKAGGGFVIGIMPGGRRGKGNDYLDLEIPTGLRDLRNTVLATAGEGAIAIGTTPGTTSEVAWAVREDKVVVAPANGVQPISGVTFVRKPGATSEFMRVTLQGQAMVKELMRGIERQAKERAKSKLLFDD